MLTKSRCHYLGTNTESPVYIAIKGQVYDVTGKDAYLPGGAYHGE